MKNQQILLDRDKTDAPISSKGIDSLIVTDISEIEALSSRSKAVRAMTSGKYRNTNDPFANKGEESESIPVSSPATPRRVFGTGDLPFLVENDSQALRDLKPPKSFRKKENNGTATTTLLTKDNMVESFKIIIIRN